MNKIIYSNYLYILLAVLIINTIYIAYYYYQPMIEFNDHRGWDGLSYFSIYNYFREGVFTKDVYAPFNNRILLPWLASHLPSDNHVINFKIINYLFINAFILSLTYFYLNIIKIRKFVISLGLLWLAFHWMGIIRIPMFSPFSNDVPLYFFQTMLLYIIWKNSYGFLLILAPVATLHKESFMIFVTLLLLYMIFSNYLVNNGKWNSVDRYENRAIVYVLLALVISIIVKYYVNNYIIKPVEPWSGLITVFNWAKYRALHPLDLLRWCAAFFIGYAGFAILAIRNIRSQYKFSHNQNLLLLFSCTYLALGYLAGHDMTRIMFLGFPFIMTLFLLMINNLDYKLISVAFIISLPVLKVFNKIPEPTYYTPTLTDVTGFFSWHAENASLTIVNSWLLYMIISVFVVHWAHGYICSINKN